MSTAFCESFTMYNFSGYLPATYYFFSKTLLLQRHPASNLLKNEISGCWRCKDSGEKQAVIILQLEKLCQIQSITIGNENSAFVELLVGKSAVPDVFEVSSVLFSFQCRL